MNKEAIDHLVEKNPKLKSSRHALEIMKPGAFCIHRSWGFGQIKNYDTAANKLIIDFREGGKEGHAMDPAFCIGKLHILGESNILVRQQKEPDTVDEMLKKQPVEVIIEILSQKHDGMCTNAELESYLKRLLGANKYKKWWTNTKKLVIKDPRIAVPVKKTDPYILRDEPLTPEQEILEEFYSNKKPKKKILLAEKLYQLSDSVGEIASDLPQILDDLTEALKSARQLTESERLHGIWVRNDLCRHLCEDVEKLEPTSTSIVQASDNLSELAEELPNAYYKRFMDLISRVYPEKWESICINLLKNSSGKLTSECIAFLMERECSDLIEEAFKKWLHENTFKGAVLYWIVKNRNTRRFAHFTKGLINTKLFSSILAAIDAEALQSSTNRRVLLADILLEDVQLVSELLSDANEEIAMDLANTLLQNQGFESLAKKSLLARFIKAFPSIQQIISGKEKGPQSEEEHLFVSQESFDARKEEYELLVSKKIPENKKAIAIAREHGDLKENSEYKMARQDQEMLLARKNMLETELARVNITDFSEAEEDVVSIGSVVEVSQNSNNSFHSYAILGAWDSKPEENILSYMTPLAKCLLGKRAGEKVSTNIDGNKETWTIKSVKRWIDCKQPLKSAS